MNTDLTASFYRDETTGNLAYTMGVGTTNCASVTTSWWPGTWYYQSSFMSEDEKLGKAFRLAQVLISKKIVKIGEDAEKFTKLVNSIKEVL